MPAGRKYQMQWQTLKDVDVDTGADPDMDAVAATALAICDDIRDYDGTMLHRQLTYACGTDPARMAQILMALAAWVDPEETLSARGARVESISARRIA